MGLANQGCPIQIGKCSFPENPLLDPDSAFSTILELQSSSDLVAKSNNANGVLIFTPPEVVPALQLAGNADPICTQSQSARPSPGVETVGDLTDRIPGPA